MKAIAAGKMQRETRTDVYQGKDALTNESRYREEQGEDQHDEALLIIPRAAVLLLSSLMSPHQLLRDQQDFFCVPALAASCEMSQTNQLQLSLSPPTFQTH
eukprot:1126654-Rhodomonas_salina.2